MRIKSEAGFYSQPGISPLGYGSFLGFGAGLGASVGLGVAGRVLIGGRRRDCFLGFGIARKRRVGTISAVFTSLCRV